MGRINEKNYQKLVKNPLPETIATIVQEKQKKHKTIVKSLLEQQLEKQALLERIRQMVQKW